MSKVSSKRCLFNWSLVLTLALLLFDKAISLAQINNTAIAASVAPSKNDTNNMGIQFNIGPAIPLLNLGSPVYQSYNLDQKFRTGFASPGLSFNISANLFLKQDWGVIAKITSARFSFNNTGFVTNKLAAGDTITNAHGSSHSLNAFLLGFGMRLPQGTASLHPRFSMLVYALAGLMNFQYGAISYDQDLMHIGLPSVTSNSVAINTGIAASYNILKRIALTLNIDLLTGNAKFPDQTAMSYSVFSTDIGLLIFLKH